MRDDPALSGLGRLWKPEESLRHGDARNRPPFELLMALRGVADRGLWEVQMVTTRWQARRYAGLPIGGFGEVHKVAARWQGKRDIGHLDFWL